LKARPEGYLIIDIGMRIVYKAMKSRRAAKSEEWKRIGKSPLGEGVVMKGASKEAAGGEIEKEDVNSSLLVKSLLFFLSTCRFFFLFFLFPFFFNL